MKVGTGRARPDEAPRGRRLRRLLPAALASAALFACGPSPATEAGPASAPAAPPNVLLIVVDTLRADHLGAWGYPLPTSPAMDALVARGAQFTECIAQASWTAASMISLLTGQPILQTIFKVPDEVPLLAERFAAAGYRTGAAVANSVLTSDAGFARGFGSYAERRVNTRKWSVKDIEHHALEFLAADEGRPWLLWLHYLDTHAPNDPDVVPWDRGPAQVFDAWERAQIEQVIAEQPAEARAELRAQIPELADIVDRYDAEIAEVDASVGKLLDLLARRGLDEDTIVVLASDHGETLFRRREHPDHVEEIRAWKDKRGLRLELHDLVKWQHYYWTYREVVRVPLVFAGPGIAPGQRIDTLASNLDLQPTLLGLCGLPVPPGPGRDLSDALRTGAPVPPVEWVTTSGDAHAAARLPDGTKVVLPSALMVERYGWQPVQYDVLADPLERDPRPLDARGQWLLQKLRQAIADDPFRAWQGADVDEETLEQLRELGYVK